MRKFVMTAAVLAALVLPAHAGQDEALTTRGAVVVYDQYCEPISKSAFKLLDMMVGSVSRFDEDEATTTAMKAYMNVGHDKFCSGLKPAMDNINHSTAPLDAYLNHQ